MSPDNPDNPENPDDQNKPVGEDVSPDYVEDDYGYDDQSEGYYDPEGEQLSTGPSVSSSANSRGVVLLLLIGSVVVFFLYLILGGDEEEEEEEAAEMQETPAVVIAPEAPVPLQLPPPPSPDEGMSDYDEDEPPPPPPPPLTEVFPSPPIAEFEDTTIDDEAMQERLRSDMLIVNARGGIGEDDYDDEEGNLESSDPNAQFANRVFRSSKASKVKANYLGDMYSTIAQGKVVHAVLETAINTDLPGNLRAVVSHDVYAEAGREPLIPKGSRLIGTYNTDALFGQGRVFIIWTRIIRPDGIDVMVNSPGIDSLGRGGIAGGVDNKYFEIYSAAILTSALNIGTAVAVESVTDAERTTTQNSTGTTTTTSPVAEAALDSVSRIGKVTGNVVNRFVNTRPTITVDQGTRIDVFVNRDLIFPSSVLGHNGQMIP